MKRLTTVCLALLFAACGGDGPTDPDPDPRPPGFSALIVDVPDSTVFVGDTLPVELLAVLENGDTVPAPDSAALEVPNGFTLLSGRRVLPVDEAAGEIVGRLNPTDSTQVRSAVDLTAHVPWRARWRCYGCDNCYRGNEQVDVDSIHGSASGAAFVYRDTTELQGRFTGTITVVRFWADGVTDTVVQDSSTFLARVRQARVDTLQANSIPNPAAVDSSTAQRPIYRSPPPGLCGGPGGTWDRGAPFHLWPGTDG